MEWKKESNDYKIFMSCYLDELKIEDFALNMINKVNRGLVKCQFFQNNLKYDISNSSALSDIFNNLNYDQVLDYILEVLNICDSISGYLLDYKNIVFENDKIFIFNDNSLNLIYLPFDNDKNIDLKIWIKQCILQYVNLKKIEQVDINSLFNATKKALEYCEDDYFCIDGIRKNLQKIKNILNNKLNDFNLETNYKLNDSLNDNNIITKNEYVKYNSIDNEYSESFSENKNEYLINDSVNNIQEKKIFKDDNSNEPKLNKDVKVKKNNKLYKFYVLILLDIIFVVFILLFNNYVNLNIEYRNKLIILGILIVIILYLNIKIFILFRKKEKDIIKKENEDILKNEQNVYDVIKRSNNFREEPNLKVYNENFINNENDFLNENNNYSDYNYDFNKSNINKINDFNKINQIQKNEKSSNLYDNFDFTVVLEENEEDVTMILDDNIYIINDLTGEKIYLVKDEITVGRTSKNDIVIDDKMVGRNHSKFIKYNDHYILKDLNSKNGTYINDEKIKEKKLENEDIIYFSKNKFIYYDEN